MLAIATPASARPETPSDAAQRLRAALGLTGLLVFHQDRSLRYTWVANPALGLDEASILGRTDAEVLGADEAQPLMQLKRRVLRSGRRERATLWVGRGDRRACFDLIVEPARDSAGHVAGLVCAAADVTQRELDAQALDAAHRQLQALAGHLQDRLEAERSAVAADVHDHLGAQLTGLRLQLDALAREEAERHPSLASKLARLAQQAQQALEGTRALVEQMRPPALEDLGLVEACRTAVHEWARQSGLRARCRLQRLPHEPEPALALDLFRVLQELLTNVARHARASRVRVSLGASAQGLRLRLADDGRGFDTKAVRRSFGLAGVHERVARHGGHLRIDSGALGTCVRVHIPCHQPAGAA